MLIPGTMFRENQYPIKRDYVFEDTTFANEASEDRSRKTGFQEDQLYKSYRFFSRVVVITGQILKYRRHYHIINTLRYLHDPWPFRQQEIKMNLSDLLAAEQRS